MATGLSLGRAHSYHDAIQQVITGVGGLGPLTIPGLAFNLVVGAHELRKARKEQYRSVSDRYFDQRGHDIRRSWLNELRRHRRRLREVFGRRAEEVHRSAREALAVAEHGVSVMSGEDARRRLEDLAAETARLDRVERELSDIVARG